SFQSGTTPADDADVCIGKLDHLTTYFIIATHSISTRAFNASPLVPNALRAGMRSFLKNVVYTVFISAHSFISASITVHLTTWSSDEPFFSRTVRIFSRVCFVSAAIPPGASLPELSVPSLPDR